MLIDADTGLPLELEVVDLDAPDDKLSAFSQEDIQRQRREVIRQAKKNGEATIVPGGSPSHRRSSSSSSGSSGSNGSSSSSNRKRRKSSSVIVGGQKLRGLCERSRSISSLPSVSEDGEDDAMEEAMEDRLDYIFHNFATEERKRSSSSTNSILIMKDWCGDSATTAGATSSSSSDEEDEDDDEHYRQYYKNDDDFVDDDSHSDNYSFEDRVEQHSLPPAVMKRRSIHRRRNSFVRRCLCILTLGAVIFAVLMAFRVFGGKDKDDNNNNNNNNIINNNHHDEEAMSSNLRGNGNNIEKRFVPCQGVFINAGSASDMHDTTKNIVPWDTTWKPDGPFLSRNIAKNDKASEIQINHNECHKYYQDDSVQESLFCSERMFTGIGRYQIPLVAYHEEDQQHPEHNKYMTTVILHFAETTTDNDKSVFTIQIQDQIIQENFDVLQQTNHELFTSTTVVAKDVVVTNGILTITLLPDRKQHHYAKINAIEIRSQK